MRADLEAGKGVEKARTGRRVLVYVDTSVVMSLKLTVVGCFSAAQKALKIPNRSAEGTKFLLTLLDSLEQVSCLVLGVLLQADLSTDESSTRHA